MCREQSSTLVTITSEAEQQLLTQLVLNSSDAVNVWIGAQRRPGNSHEFTWNDGSTVQRFTNWAIGHPTDNVGRNCVQMRSQLSRTLDMEWVDIACTIPNWFICQKLQFWLPENIQHAVLSVRREVRDSVYSLTNEITDLTNQLETANTDLKYLQENPSKNSSNQKVLMNFNYYLNSYSSNWFHLRATAKSTRTGETMANSTME